MKIKLLLVCAVAGNCAIAQIPVLTKNNLMSVGDTLNLITVDSVQAKTIVPGLSGANKSWVFPALVAQDSGLTIRMNPASTPFFTDFPSANYADYQSASDMYDYYNYQTNVGGSYLGFEQPGVKDFYSSPIITQDNFTYLNSFTNTARAVATYPNYTIRVVEYDTVICDGYGSLNLEGKTYAHTLRTQKRYTVIDSAFMGTVLALVVKTHTIAYSWNSSDYKDVLLQLVMQDSVAPVVYFNRKPIPVSVALGIAPSAVSPAQQIAVFPNPFKQQTAVALDINGLSMVTMMVFNALGQEVAVLENKKLDKGHYIYSLNVTEKGIYFLKTTINGVDSVQKIIQAE
jgi:hypothetical protein